jgi:16S rRNA (guanine527-N7)-methyltransferase
MDHARIAGLLAPFITGLTESQLASISIYLDLLLRWNARINLTGIRGPEQIITRHFGESLFTAARLLDPSSSDSAIDVGSGAGFPGLPLKIWAPQLRLTLVESQQRKATFLREVTRALKVKDITVFAGRAEHYDQRGSLVTLRAVERFQNALPVAASLSGGRLALLTGTAQAVHARQVLSGFQWDEEIIVPQSSARVLLVGTKGTT